MATTKAQRRHKVLLSAFTNDQKALRRTAVRYAAMLALSQVDDSEDELLELTGKLAEDALDRAASAFVNARTNLVTFLNQNPGVE